MGFRKKYFDCVSSRILDWFDVLVKGFLIRIFFKRNVNCFGFCFYMFMLGFSFLLNFFLRILRCSRYLDGFDLMLEVE